VVCADGGGHRRLDGAFWEGPTPTTAVTAVENCRSGEREGGEGVEGNLNLGSWVGGGGRIPQQKKTNYNGGKVSLDFVGLDV
jgi:hypothetical protein